MYKIMMVLVALWATTLMAEEIHWAKDFQSGIQQAQKENKPVLFIFSRHSCKYCVILEDQTLNTPEVTKKLNKEFISIISYSDEQDYTPKELWRPGTPTIWILKSNGAPLYKVNRYFPIMGAIPKEYLVQILEKAKQDYDQFQNQNSGK
jgi:thioredoxin-related protein